MTESDTPQGQDNASADRQPSENSGQTRTDTTMMQDEGKPGPRCTYSGQQAPNPKWWHRIDWSQVVLDALLLIVGIKLAYIYTGQLNQMIESNEITRQAMESSQRAYIAHRGMKHDIKTITNPSGKQTRGFEFTAQWENGGNTPAVGVLTMVGNIVQAEEITEAEFMGKILSFPPPTAMASIGPRSPMDSRTMRQPEDFATDDLDIPRFFWGWMLYRDIFPNSKIHVTEFCWKTTSIAPDGKGEYTFDATVCNHHNCVDEFCEDYAAITTLSLSN